MRSIIMKSMLVLMSILISTSAMLADSLYIEPFTLQPGESKDVSIFLTNSQPVSALQADLYISTGLELVKQGDDWMTLTERSSADHTLIVNYTGPEDWTKFVCFSNTNTSFSGSEGAVIQMRIKASEDFVGGSIGLTGIKLSDSSNQDLILEDCWVGIEGLILAENIVLSPEAMEMKVGEVWGLSAEIYPENATDKTVSWTTDNASVATVDANGNITAVSLGTATITATCGSVSATCIVTVAATPAESIVLSNTEAQLKAGETLTLTATVLPEDATDKTVTWTTDNASVATVDANGNVTAVSLGTATITATCGSVSATCIVTVAATPAESIVLSNTEAQLKAGETLTLTATVAPEDATDKTVTWTTDNASVATVDANGNVTAIALGTATITASCGSVSASCAVTVVATPVESITLSFTDYQLKVGETFHLATFISPDDATDKTVVWTSDNEAVATVDDNGNVTAVSVGVANITASCGNASALCRVSVVATEIESIILTPDSWTGEEGDSFTITATVLPEDATDKTLLWSSSDESIATVDAEGKVSVLKEGICVITATAADGSGVFAECHITSTSGVDGIISDYDRFDVFGMNGVLIRKDCDHDALNSLTPGIYIIRIGGETKKVVVR